MNNQYYVYILTNQRNSVLYTGATSDLEKRIYEHKSKIIAGFTKKYNVNKVVYYEIFNNIDEAIKREKQIKSGSRKNKIKLIENANPDWNDLAEKF